VDWTALGVSVQLFFWTMVVLLIGGTPVAYWLTFLRFWLTFAFKAIVALPLVLPPTVVGFYGLASIVPRSPLGRLYREVTGDTLPFSCKSLLLASVLYSLPLAVQPFASAFGFVDRRLIEASRCLGASSWKTFHRVIVPLSLPRMVTGMILSFAHRLGEFGAVLIVGGNLAGRSRAASISIYDNVQAFHYSAAIETSMQLPGV